MTARHWLWWAVVMGIIVAISYLGQTRPWPPVAPYLVELEPTADQT